MAEWWNHSKSDNNASPEKPSIASLKNILTDWALVYGKRITSEEVEIWMRLFQKVHPKALAIAIEEVTKNSERMPAPGTLTKAIALAYERNPGLSGNSKLLHRVGVDNLGISCWFWSDEPVTPAYSATDCPEGRAFLATLAGVSGLSADKSAKYMEKWATKDAKTTLRS